ncbi:conserved membrane hypothetical protein [Candidatus Nitrotoga sp. HW29]|uniref:hypothetical protein n=1 Tax=Candidatus Nitrotoga sp. HW29 TaxID=2886963 RepID=UPI001EF1A527|nr:hypothetical protein [Candidatus Nitrotoga sp. HW29]CAH1905930.1 conserved membrane hypothetical protein [Candidatus Nitrotoga sp. HW29]
MNSRYVKGFIAVLVGMAINYLGDKALGVNIEIFTGISTFTFPWMIDIFLVPFIAGLAVSWIFGLGGKWLACLPPLFVRCISFVQLTYFDNASTDADMFFQVPLAYWGPCLILVVEAANFGGILGEVWKGVYRRPNKENEETNITVPTKITT